jgi:hypothetical protein
MEGFTIDPSLLSGMDFAEKIARYHSDQGEDLIELFATFAVMVMQEDLDVGLRSLDVANDWFCEGRTVR